MPERPDRPDRSDRPDRETATPPGVVIVGRTAVVRPVGEIDIDTAPSLSRALAHALTYVATSRADRIVADCSRVTFCDSSGLNALIAARLQAVEAGTTIGLSNPAPQLQRLLQMTGAAPLFPREDPA
ncbi:STAS domain-containing protein [Streptomyces sp. WAC05950]|uniref:STAS domain-containing protein n=1 Tax=Streptomyces sp. WAC05950 TaxID=2487419 RepID=UPI00163C685F|nr:STAS domain-containing protein [Streptomyces sp. WAC05950]